MDQTLSVAILERLERRLIMEGAPVIHDAVPGLTIDQISRLTQTFPATLPSEAELWWSWRRLGEGRILPDTQYVPLEACVAHYEWRRQWAMEQRVSQQSSEVKVDEWWHPLWLPIFVVDSGIVVVIDVSESDGRSAPLRRIDWQSVGDEHFKPVVAPSLGRYVTDLLDALDAGDYIYDADHGLWTPAPAS